jgi:hypothetical protein
MEDLQKIRYRRIRLLRDWYIHPARVTPAILKRLDDEDKKTLRESHGERTYVVSTHDNKPDHQKRNVNSLWILIKTIPH